MRILFALASLLAACSQPSPTPTPAACSTTDLLSCAVFDCHADWVQNERGNISSDVGLCLVGDTTAPCLVALIQRAHPDTVGCVTRDRAAMACATITAGTGTSADNQACTNGRNWIRAEKVSFR
jgi:hypothetical protein